MLLIVSIVQYLECLPVCIQPVFVDDGIDVLLFSWLSFSHYPSFRIYHPAVPGVVGSFVASCSVACYEIALVVRTSHASMRTSGQLATFIIAS